MKLKKKNISKEMQKDFVVWFENHSYKSFFKDCRHAVVTWSARIGFLKFHEIIDYNDFVKLVKTHYDSILKLNNSEMKKQNKKRIELLAKSKIQRDENILKVRKIKKDKLKLIADSKKLRFDILSKKKKLLPPGISKELRKYKKKK